MFIDFCFWPTWNNRDNDNNNIQTDRQIHETIVLRPWTSDDKGQSSLGDGKSMR